MLEKIIKNLETGNYRIEYREHCDCSFDWRINENMLAWGTNSKNCWVENVLIMDDLAGQYDDALSVGNDGMIAAYNSRSKFSILVDMERDLKEKLEEELIVEIKNSDAYLQLCTNIMKFYTPDSTGSSLYNELHFKRKRASLVKWLKKHNFATYVYDLSDSFDGYVCVLLMLPKGWKEDSVDAVWNRQLHVPKYWRRKTPEQWAKKFVDINSDWSFMLLNNLYAIDYCWYDDISRTTASHEVGERLYVDFVDAIKAFEELTPEGMDCYDLSRYTIDVDGEVVDCDDQVTKWGEEAARRARFQSNSFAPQFYRVVPQEPRRTFHELIASTWEEAKKEAIVDMEIGDELIECPPAVFELDPYGFLRADYFLSTRRAELLRFDKEGNIAYCWSDEPEICVDKRGETLSINLFEEGEEE